jgi:hypothetical protein
MSNFFTSIETFFSKALADIKALAVSPVGLTIDAALATAGGVGAAYAIAGSVDPSNKVEVANDILLIEGALSTGLTNTVEPTASQLAGILTALKANDPIFSTLAGMVSTQLFSMLQTYDGTPWASVMGSFLNGLKYGALAMGGTAPAAATTSTTTVSA